MLFNLSPISKKIIFQYLIALVTVFVITGFNFLLTGTASIFFSTVIMRPYFSQLVSKHNEQENHKIVAKVYATVSSISVAMLLSVSAFDKTWFPTHKDTISILLIALLSAIFVYYFNYIAFNFEVNRIKEYRNKNKQD